MFNRQISKTRRHSRSKVLEVRVLSPRIAWLSFLKCMGRIAKFACALLAVLGIGWGLWLGIQRAFYKNPDFQLKVIDLNPNSVIQESGLAEIVGIDPPPSLFAIDMAGLVDKLKVMPGIADAHAERHLPGTLVVRIVTRTPRAWISSSNGKLPAERQIGGLLVDHAGFAYLCPPLQFETAKNLPVIQLPTSEKFPVCAGQCLGHPELVHCFRLLDAAMEVDPDSVHWIDSLKQENAWSLLLVTRQGTTSTFGLGDHERQIHRLRLAMDHSNQKGYVINTINLIPKYNIPITLHSEVLAPRTVLARKLSPQEIQKNSRTQEPQSSPIRN